MRSLSALLKLETPLAPGPSPSYMSAHVVLVLLAIGDEGNIGRQALAQRAGLGEGAVRTVIKRLKTEELVVTHAQGCRLTPKGRGVYSEVKRTIPAIAPLPATGMTVGGHQVAVVVKSASGAVRSGIEQRDAAIRAGATGATTYLVKGSRFRTPGSTSDVEKEFPDEGWARLRSDLSPADGDVVIICGSGSGKASLIGAVSAALTLLR